MKLIVAGAALLLTAAAPAPTAPAYDWKLTPTGWGPVHIGMNRDQVQKALNDQLEGDAFDNYGDCVELFPEAEALKGSFFMFQSGKLTRISVSAPSHIVTPRGVGVGTSADEVRKAYGEQLQAEPNHYLDLPAEYLTFWLKPDKSGVRFETDAQRKVEIIHAGNDSIRLIEGCA